MNGYICLYQGKRFEVYANTSFEAQNKCAQENKIPLKKKHLITVILAEKEGKPVTHNADF